MRGRFGTLLVPALQQPEERVHGYDDNDNRNNPAEQPPEDTGKPHKEQPDKADEPTHEPNNPGGDEKGDNRKNDEFDNLLNGAFHMQVSIARTLAAV